MSRVAGTPHDPGGGTSRRASECEKLNGSVAVESRDGDNAVLDGRCGPSTYCEGTGDFEDQTEDHGLLVGNGAGGNARGPCVCNIVCEEWLGGLIERVIDMCRARRTGTVVVRLKEGEEGADGKDVSVFRKHHVDGISTLRHCVSLGRVGLSVVFTRKGLKETNGCLGRYTSSAHQQRLCHKRYGFEGTTQTVLSRSLGEPRSRWCLLAIVDQTFAANASPNQCIHPSLGTWLCVLPRSFQAW